MSSLLAKDSNLKLHSERDALDVIASGLPGCIFTPDELHPEFFDLRNRIAGEVFQKLINYGFPIAIVISDDHGYGERVTELVRDHRRHPSIRFFTTIEAARAWLEPAERET